MTKKQMTHLVAETVGIQKNTTKQVIDLFLRLLKENIVNDNHIELRGFGSFDVTIRKKRKFINPKTKKKQIIPKRKIVTFTSGKKFKKQLAKSLKKKGSKK